jgi:hypothetical protein
MWRRSVIAFFFFLSSTIPQWAIDGLFQGRVVEPPASHAAVPGWIFVQGRNRLLRRVEVSHADIVFGEKVPVSQRHKCSMECLTAGQEVLVLAEQDGSGEWRAKRVEILKLTTHWT